MTIQISTLRPGLLISLKTSITGNVSYRKQEIEAEHLTPDGAQEARWETERRIDDPVEYEAAKKARSKARSLITGVCSASAFGLLCPESAADELNRAVREARQVADDFNAAAKLSRIGVYVITGRIAPDDVEAVRAINSEVRELMDEMSRGIEQLDVKAVREAAGKAKALGAMLSQDAAARVQIAVDTARQAARKIVKAGEQAAQEIDRQAIAKIAESRTSFLDLDPAAEIATPLVDARGIDLAPTDTIATPAVPVPSFEME